MLGASYSFIDSVCIIVPIFKTIFWVYIVRFFESKGINVKMFKISSSLNRSPPYFSESVCIGVSIGVMSINYKFWSFRKAIQNFNNTNIKIIPILSEKLKTHEDYHIRIWWDRVLLSFPKNRTGRKPTKLSLRVWYLINWKFYIFKRNRVWSKKTYNTESFFQHLTLFVINIKIS